MPYYRSYEQPRPSFFSPGFITPVVRALLYANGAVFLAQFIFASSFKHDPYLFSRFFGLVPALVVKGYVWQIFTYMFLHANFWHIVFNMLTLYMFGPDVERAFGRRRFLFFYLSAGVVAGALTVATAFIAGTAATPVIGASGAIFAVLVAAAVFFPDRLVIFILFPMRMRTLVLLFVGAQVYSILTSTAGNVAVWAHLGGAAYGYLFIRLRPAYERLYARLSRRWERAFMRQRQQDRRRLDEILEKVSREGMHQLTSREKKFLNRMSKEYRR